LSRTKTVSKWGDVTELLKATPELNNCPPEKWEETHDFLKREGFHLDKFPYIVSQNPKILLSPKDKVFKSINSWRALQFGERDTIVLLEKYPELLEFKFSNDVTERLEMLKEFVGSGSKVFKLVLNSPSVLTENLNDVKDKIEYLTKKMKVEPVEVYKSEAMSLSLLQLKIRHKFLERLGLYIVKKKKVENEVSKNPKLYTITDTSDKKFATKICHVTFEEFETFQELFKRELKEQEEENDKYDEDDDDEGLEETMHEVQFKVNKKYNKTR
jgi:mTERF domain-containing protein, mitochondrial